jgi:hypothetical protein
VLRRLLVAGLIVLSVAGGLYFVRARRCSSWQGDYKRFLYVEMMKNSPIIYTPEEIDRIMRRPAGCERPAGLSDEASLRYRQEQDLTSS